MQNSSLISKIDQDFVESMKNKQELKKSTLRLLKTAISTESKKEGKELTDADVLRVIATSVKSTEKQIQVYKDLNQEDIVESLSKELTILKSYLPTEATEEEIDNAITIVISRQTDINSKVMGKVIKEVKEELNKPLDSKLLAEKVKNKLNA
jgi:uncharacterized protein YqeY